MDNFVFAVLPKKTAAKMQKELQDLVKKRIIFCNPVINKCVCASELCLLIKKLIVCTLSIFEINGIIENNIDFLYILCGFFLFRRSSVQISAVGPSMIFLLHMLC